MMSQPASACTSACRTSTATVSSLRILPSSISPSWPWLVKGSSATSQSTPRSGNSFLIARTDLQTRLSAFSASEPVLVAQGSLGIGKQRDAGDVEPGRALGVADRLIDGDAVDPGHRGDGGALVLWPSTTNSGQIRSSVVRTFSRTSRRAHSALRLRRGRVIRSSAGEARAAGCRGASRISIGRPNLIAI